MERTLTEHNRYAISVAKVHMGHVAWGTVALSVAVLLLYVVSFYLVAINVMPVWLAFIAVCITTYMAYTPVHEAVHNNINGDNTGLQWLNDACGYLCAQLLIIPYSAHKIEHFTHHRYTNQPNKDPDYIISGVMRGGLFSIIAISKFLWNQITYPLHNHWGEMPLSGKLIYTAELSVAVVWRAALFMLLPVSSAMLLVVMAYVISVVFTSYWFAYRPHHPYQEVARYKNTSSLIMPRWMKPLEWFWLGQNLHSIHHAFPRIPFYRYHAVFRIIEPALRAHDAPVIGVFNRNPIEITAHTD